MNVPHPWRRLGRLKRLNLIFTDDLPPYLRGATDGGRIWMRSNLSQVERRCTLAHELEHVDRGHTSCQPPGVESIVDHAAARFLLPDPRVVADAMVWAHDMDEAADFLWVTPRVLYARLDRRRLHPAEVAIMRARFDEIEHVA